MARPRLLGDLSLLQVAAGALAAMTSAWIASSLGVAGTIIGAAVGSGIASISTAVYLNTLHKGRTLITESGTVISTATAEDPGVSTNAAPADSEQTSIIATSDEVDVSPTSGFSWKVAGAVFVLVMAVSVAAIAGWELVSGNSFGNADRPSIGRPWQDSPTTEPTTTPTTEPTTTPTTTATTTPTTAAPTTEPTTSPTTEPTTAPTTEPTATETTAEPTE